MPWHAQFTDIALEAGLGSPVIYGGVKRKDYIIESIGCGAAFLDYNNDGWIDIFLLSGARMNDTPEDAANRLYKNNRDGTFADVTKRAGLVRSGWASGVTTGDYDNDGNEDLFITYWGANVLYRNNGDGTFADVTNEAGFPQDRARWGAGCTFLDFDRDGHLDLFVSNYLKFDLEQVPRPGSDAHCNWKGVPVHCGPRGLPPVKHLLYRNRGDGSFMDVSASSGISKIGGTYGMTAVSTDFDGDAWPDIYVACDSTPSLLFINNRDGTFREEGIERGVALSEDGMEQAGMGVGVGDYDLDGDLDIFKTHFADDTNVLYRNDSEGHFEDVTISSGLGVETRFVGWGAGIVDLDNNSLPDLFYVTGNVYPEIESKLPGYPYKTPRVIFRNLGRGRFEELIEEAGPGVAAAHSGRGAAFGDFDNDGDVDILVVNMNEAPSLLRNGLTTDQHWLKVKLIGVKSNRSAIGAQVLVTAGEKRWLQPVMAQSSFYSVDDRRLHYGLGSTEKVDLEVRWPSGTRELVGNIAVDQLVFVKEGHGVTRNERFSSPK